MEKLVNYLAGLDSCENQWGLWVNPADLDDYRVGQLCFKNGGLSDEKVFVGTLANLSCGQQSTAEAVEHYINNNCELTRWGDRLIGSIRWGDRIVRVNPKALRRAYEEGRIDPEFRDFLESQAHEIELLWAQNDAELKVSEIRRDLIDLIE